MTLAEYKSWRAGVDAHYGSMDKFPDAPTIRNVRKMMAREADTMRAVLRVSARARARMRREGSDGLEFMDSDLREFETAIADLDGWLEQKGLTL